MFIIINKETYKSQENTKVRTNTKQEVSVECNTLNAEEIAKYFPNVDLFNIFVSQADMEKSIDFCDGKMNIDCLSYMAGLDCSLVNLEEMALATEFHSWVEKEIQMAINAIDEERRDMVKGLIEKWGFKRTISSLTSHKNIDQMVKKELAKQEEKIFASLTFNTKEAKEEAYLSAKAETVIKLGESTPGKWEKLPMSDKQYNLFLHHYNLQMAYKPYEDDETDEDREYGMYSEWADEMPIYETSYSMEVSK